MYSCSYCDYNCLSLDLYRNHFSYHKLVPNFYFICPICELKFDVRNSFNKHMLRNHVDCEKNKLKIECLTCSTLFYNKKIYIQHLFIHLEENIEIVCNIDLCEKNTVIKIHLCRIISVNILIIMIHQHQIY